MLVTNIRQQVKRNNRYSIYIDEKYSFSLSENGLLASGIHVGVALSKQQLDALKDASKKDKAYNQALNQIARRLRSEWEVRDYLRRKDYEPTMVDEIIERLQKARLLDDSVFARAWVENRRLLKSTSKRRLVAELRQKRVSDEIIEQTLAADETDEQTVLRNMIQKKRRQPRYQDEQKLMAYLVRQGFQYSDIKNALAEISQE